MSSNKKVHRAVKYLMKAALAKAEASNLEFRSMTLLELSGDGQYIHADIKAANEYTNWVIGIQVFKKVGKPGYNHRWMSEFFEKVQ